jgi:hypothetical protein
MPSIRAKPRNSEPGIFVHLPRVLRQLRGKRSCADVSRATGLAQNHIYQIEERPVRHYPSGRSLPARRGMTPHLRTLEVLLQYYNISLCKLGKLLRAAADAPIEYEE